MGLGKSPFLSALCLVEALADVVPDGWDAEGRPVGKPWAMVRTPLVQVAAVTEDQVRTNTWGAMLEMVDPELDPPVFDYYRGLEPMDTFVNLPKGRIQMVTASASSVKGARAVFSVWDQALALDTPIPSPSGWTTMGDLSDGDVIFGSDGRPVRVDKAKPVMTGRPCYRVSFSDGTSVVADAGHLWSAKPHSGSATKFRVVRTEDFLDGRKWRIPLAPAQQRPDADLACPPYLLGYWLGDGTRGKSEIAVARSDADDLASILSGLGVETRQRIYGDAAAVNMSFSRRCGYQNDGRPAYARALQSFACYTDKSAAVPSEYLMGSIEQRTDLLAGLMDSDGHISADGHCTFISTSEQLADLVVELLRSLGQLTTGAKWRPDSRYTGGGCWRVRFTPRSGLVPFRLPRKVSAVRDCHDLPTVRVTSVEKVASVPVRCIAVDSEDHLFAFGVSGHLTHNTEEWTASNGGKRLAAVMADNAAKVGGSYVETPNAFTPGLSSVAEESATEWAAMKEGRTRGDKSLLYDHREAPPETDLTDRESLLAGLRFAYGDSSAHPDGCVIHDPPCSPGWADHDAHIARAWSLSGGNTEQNFRANFLGQITHASDAWVSQIEWAACADASKVLKPGDAIALGFDGSLGRAKGKPDATALIGVRVSDGFVFEVGIWEASDDKSTWEDWYPPLVEIEAALADCFKTYKVVAFYADPAAGWSGHLATWAARWSANVPVKARRDAPFTWNMSHQTNVQVAIENVEQAIFNQELSHDGGGLALTRHVLNTRRRFRNKKLALGKASDYSINKIDAAVAMVLAWQGYLDAKTAGYGQAREKVRGIRVR